MSHLELKDIIIAARHESQKMQHYYIGVEHLFVALLDMPGSLARSILEDHGLKPDYVIDLTRKKIGKGSKRRLWAGTPYTPRAASIIQQSRQFATNEGRVEPNEQDILTAIMHENQSMPVRVLHRLGLDSEAIINIAQNSRRWQSVNQDSVDIELSPRLTMPVTLGDDDSIILRRMFHGYARIRIESSLTGGYSGASVLIITPVQTDGREDAAVVVKIADTDDIMDEAMRYELHVKNTLPPLTARLEDKPIAPDICHHAGVKYTLVTKPGKTPQDLRAAAAEFGAAHLSGWMRQQLYAQFGPTWWQQRREFNFQVWTEYDWLLPPLFTIHFEPLNNLPETTPLLRVPLSRAKINQISYGDVVILENFTVQRVLADEKALQISYGRGNEATRRAHKIRVENVDFDQSLYYRGEIIERIAGRVWGTRSETLENAARELQPPFDIHTDTFFIPELERFILPNPIAAYEDLLYFHIDGSMSKIHGDLHLGNILIGPADNPFLIDFAHSRDGHTVFDWALLEVSLLIETIMPLIGNHWKAIYQAIPYLDALNHMDDFPHIHPQLDEAFVPLRAIREIVQETLHRENNWIEYHIALVFCALRALTWGNTSLGARRLMLLVAALSTDACRRPAAYIRQTGSSNPEQPGDTEF